MGVDDKNNRVGSVLDKRLHGVPTEFGVSDAGQMLKMGKQQVELLEEMTRRQRVQSPTPSTSMQSPQVNVTPQVHIDIPNVARELNPQFSSLVEGQQELAEAVRESGYYGQLALQESRLQNHALANLDGRAQEAHGQRNAALGILSRSLMEHEKVSQLLQIGDQFLFEGNQIAQAGNAKLDAINGALLSGFGEIGAGISALTAQQVASTAALIHQMRGSEDVFLWAQREQHSQLRSAIHTLQNPRAAQSLESWRIGETARQAGRFQVAQVVFQQSLEANPTNARSYYSLAMMALDQQSPDLAGPLLDEAIAFSVSEPRFHAALLLLRGKIDRMNGNMPHALRFVFASLSENNTNLEAWYELAVIYAMMGDNGNALYCVRNLATAARKRSLEYMAKIFSNPILFKFIPYLSQ